LHEHLHIGDVGKAVILADLGGVGRRSSSSLNHSGALRG
jgi:hypothetical protein